MMGWILGVGCLSSFVVVVVLPYAFRMCQDIEDAPPQKKYLLNDSSSLLIKGHPPELSTVKCKEHWIQSPK